MIFFGYRNSSNGKLVVFALKKPNPGFIVGDPKRNPSPTNQPQTHQNHHGVEQGDTGRTREVQAGSGDHRGPNVSPSMLR